MPEHLSKKLINWASILEENTREQALMSSSLPFIFPHLALMPDAHLGKGATVGSVIPTLGAIMPAAVGVDIGCGMIAVKTQWNEEQIRAAGPLRDLREDIESRVPMSAGAYNTALSYTALKRVEELKSHADALGVNPDSYAGNWRTQLGSLGSGNHFIEVCLDETDQVWLFLHSGSRGVGNKIAQHFIDVAVEQCEKRWIQLPHKDLAYLVEGDPEFWAYIRALRWAQDFAMANREEMMDRVMMAMAMHMGEDVLPSEFVNCHHNFTEQEKHFGKTVWVSRKGAIRAQEGDLGLIPGSMGTCSYVVQGKGNRLALNSSPHGAGRNHSRGVAKRMFTQEQLREAMVGIEYRDTDAFLDEHPNAYKDVEVIMRDADDLVTIKHQLRQIVNCKGS